MRGRLARPMAPSPPNGKSLKRRKAKGSWFWPITVFVALVLISGLWVGKDLQGNTAPAAPSPISPLPSPPPELSVNDQAFYWAYALYDMEKFRETFGAQSLVAVNSHQAKENLKTLLPQTTDRVRYLIGRYLPPGGLP